MICSRNIFTVTTSSTSRQYKMISRTLLACLIFINGHAVLLVRHRRLRSYLFSAPDPVKNIRAGYYSKYIKASVGLYSLFGAALAFHSIQDSTVEERRHKLLFNSNIHPGDKVLEIGFGTGQNLVYYPTQIDLVGIDPFIEQKNVDTKKYFDRDISFTFLNASADSIPFNDNTFDVVVSTLVFCTVDNPEKCLNEVLRVLKSKGRYISCEHILGDTGSMLAMQQQLFDPIQQVVANGCHLTRKTDRLFQSFVESHNSRQPGRKKYFSKIIQMDSVILHSQWPISKQLFTVLEK